MKKYQPISTNFYKFLLISVLIFSIFFGFRISFAQTAASKEEAAQTAASKEGTTATTATPAAPTYTIDFVSPNEVNKNKEYSFYAETDIPSLTKDLNLKCVFIPNANEKDDPKNMITATLGLDGKLTALYAYPNTGNLIAFFACKYNVTNKASTRVLGLQTSIIVKSFIGKLIDNIIDAVTPSAPPSSEPPSPESPAPKSAPGAPKIFSGNCLTEYKALLECNSPPTTSFLWLLSCFRGTANELLGCGK